MQRGHLWLALRWLAVAAAVVAISVAVFELHRADIPKNALSLTQAEFLPSDADEPPGAGPWMPVDLPDDWRLRAGDARQGWYRFALHLNVPPNRLWGLYLPSLNMNAGAWLNGKLLGDGGRFTDPLARNWNRPLYFAIPNGLLQPGENTVYIRLATQPALSGLLGPVHLGPAADLQPVHARRLLLRYTLSQVIVIVLFAVGLFIAALWYQRRHDTLYLWFSVAMWVWGLHNLNFIAIDIALPARAWDWAMFVSLNAFAIVATLFVHRFLGLRRVRLERALFALGAALAVMLAVVDERAFYVLGARVGDTLTLLLGLYPVGLLLLHFWRSARLDVLLLLMSGMLLVVFGTHDLLVVNHVLSREDGFVMHYSAPLVLAVFAAILVRRFAAALNESEALNRELEQRIAAKTHELTRNYERLGMLQRRQVLAEERARIMRDMHDGMGGHLVSTLALVEGEHARPEAVREALRVALDDLRLMIDSMEDVGGDLTAVLGMLRERLEPRLRSARIRLRWRVGELPSVADFGPHKALQVLRIVQEAITNSLRHAGAGCITLCTGTATADGREGVFIEVQDDGAGVDAARPRGRGLDNMARRAHSIGARLSVDSDGDGTRVHLWLALTPCAAGNPPED